MQLHCNYYLLATFAKELFVHAVITDAWVRFLYDCHSAVSQCQHGDRGNDHRLKLVLVSRQMFSLPII